MTEYKVTNLAKDTRKFRDGWLGKDILVEPKQTVITKRPPKENEIWKVETHTEETEQTEEKKVKKEVSNKNEK